MYHIYERLLEMSPKELQAYEAKKLARKLRLKTASKARKADEATDKIQEETKTV